MKNPKLTQEALKQSIDSLSVALGSSLEEAFDVIQDGLAQKYKGKLPPPLKLVLTDLAKEIWR